MRAIRTIVIHHTGRSNSTVESIRRYHTVERGWNDIGYHFVIYKDGTLHRGRPIYKVGAHVDGFNADSIGIVLVGNYEFETPPQPQLNMLQDLLTELFVVHHLNPGDVRGHCEFPTTKPCPGRNVFTRLPSIVTAAARAGDLGVSGSASA